MIDRLKRIYYKIKDYKYTKTSYAQEGEDLLLERIFKGERTGFYLDVGAYHPKRFSNTYLFYRKGWKGINIDAMPGSMQLFKRLRPNDINIEAGISQDAQTLTYYTFAEPAYNGFNRHVSENRDFKIIDEKEIKTTTLRLLLDQYLPENQEISFLSIDVEGLELEVLKSNNWKKYRPKNVLVEILEEKVKDIFETEINDFMLSIGYSFYCKSPNTVFYKRES